ncbi:MAG: tRNA dihydrouridine synthase DusB [Clostridia bacterium]|nr:tRNA dihydrouridine synthase DusB [Clostridia bacterium]
MPFEYRLTAAPMAGISSRVYRDIVRAHGADLAYGEMVSAQALVYQNRKTLELLDITDEQAPRLVQLFGAVPEHVAEAAAIVAELGAQYIDINMGCPVPKVVKNNEGSALLRQPELAERLVKAAATAGLPVTVKMRAGWDGGRVNAVEFAQRMEQAGAAWLALHARTREQFYQGRADWRLIAAVKRAVAIPLIGNGDIFQAGDALAMLEQTGCDGVMVGRGMLGNPWLFADIRAALAGQQPPGRPAPQIIIAQALAHLKEQIQRSEHWLVRREGEDSAAVRALAEKLAVQSLRHHLGWYIKGLRGSADLRRRLNTLTGYAQIKALFAAYLRDGSAAVEDGGSSKP